MPAHPAPATPTQVTVRVEGGEIVARNHAGAQVRFAVAGAADGFNPLELQSAALGICTAITLRNELRALGPAHAGAAFALQVRGCKAPGKPARLESLEVDVALAGAERAAVDAQLLQRAERACTIGNTLHAGAQVRIGYAAEVPPAD